jgi:amino acid transporter
MSDQHSPGSVPQSGSTEPGRFTPEHGRDFGELRHGAIGLPSAMAMSLAYISPTLAILFLSSFIASHAGASGPFTFAIGTLGVILMASTLAQFTKRIPSAGSFYTFVARSLGSPVGFVTGWVLLLAYGLQSPLNTVLFGTIISDFLQRHFGLGTEWWIWALLIILIVGALAWLSVARSMEADLLFVAVEVAIIGVLFILIIVKGGAGGQAPRAFTPTFSPTGLSGLGLAFAYVILAFTGFESSTTIAEETRNPRRTVPIALIGSVALTGIWFVFATYAIVVGYGVHHMSALAAATTPVSDLATRYIGSWYSTLVDLAAISANVAVLIAIHNANFRIVYACGREELLLPKMLGRTHPRFKTPYTAILAYSIAAAIAVLVFGFLWGPRAAYGYLGYFASVGMMPIYIITSISLIVFILTHHRDEFNLFLHFLLPVGSILVFAGALLVNVNPLPAAPLGVFPFFLVGWIILGTLWMLWLRRKDPAKLDLAGKIIFMDRELTTVATQHDAEEGLGQAIS